MTSRFSFPTAWGFVLLFCCFTAISAAQRIPIPEKAWEAYRAAYPEAEATEWGSQDEGFVVSFYEPQSQRAMRMQFNQKGRWENTITALDFSEVDAGIREYIEQRFERYYATAFETDTRKKKRFLELVIDTPTHLYTLSFNNKGRLIKEYREGIDGD